MHFRKIRTFIKISFLYLFHKAESFLRTIWFSTSQKILRILWNPKVYYRIHKSPPPVPIVNLINPVHTLIYNYLNIHFNIILPSRSGPSKCSLPLRFPHQNLSSPPCYMPRPSHYSRFDHPNNSW